jgi:excinuclease ABC subunit C
VDVGLLRRTLALVKRVFPLRQRPLPLHRDRTCLNFDIGRCPGVCQRKISPESYHHTLRRVAMVFQGRNDELLALLAAQMERHAEWNATPKGSISRPPRGCATSCAAWSSSPPIRR